MKELGKETVVQRRVFLGAVLLVMFLCIGYLFSFSRSSHSSPESERVRIGENEYVLEKADTEEKRVKGLGERDTLCPACGMLFLFDYPDRYSFWMKGMRFPLDIIWLSGNEIVSLEHRIPADSQKVYVPDRDANTVIELNAGALDAVRSGDIVEFLH